MLQRVIDYEFKTIQFRSRPSVEKLHNKHNQHHYSLWNLQETVSKISSFLNFQLRLIGHSENSHILGFFYSLIIGCLEKNKHNEQLFIKFKYQLYSLSQEFLSPEEQKVFVQNMCLLQYSKNIVGSLRKISHFQNLILQLFVSYKKKIVTQASSFQLEKLQQLKLFSSLFDFVTFQMVSECVGSIFITDSQFFIIEEKQIWFIMTPKEQITKNTIKKSCDEAITSQSKTKQSSKKKVKVKTNNSINQFYNSPLVPLSPKFNQYNTPKFIHDSPKQKYRSSKNFQSKEVISPFQFSQSEQKIYDHSTKRENQTSQYKKKQKEQNIIESERSVEKNNIWTIRTSFAKEMKNTEENRIPQKSQLVENRRRKDFVFQSLGLTSLNKLRDSLEKSKSKSREKEKNLSREKYKIPKFILEKKRNQSFYEKRWSPKKELRTSFNQQKKLSKFQQIPLLHVTYLYTIFKNIDFIMIYVLFFDKNIVKMQMDIIFLKNQNTVDPAVIKKLNHVSVYVCEGEWLKYSSSNIQMQIVKWDVQTFILNENKMKSIIKSIQHIVFEKLKQLYLYGNNIESIQNINKLGFPELQNISIANNKLNKIQIIKKVNWPSLLTIFLNQNPITDYEILAKMKFWDFNRFQIDGPENSTNFESINWVMKLQSKSIKQISISKGTKQLQKSLRSSLNKKFRKATNQF